LYAEACRFRHPPEEAGRGGGEYEVAVDDGPVSARALRQRRQRTRVKKKGKCGIFRRFLLDTFGLEALSQGGPFHDSMITSSLLSAQLYLPER
jgi:hypothetical protein